MPKGPQLIKSRNRPPFCPPAKSPVPWPGLLLALSFRMDQRIRVFGGGECPGLGTISILKVRLLFFRGSSCSPSNLWGSSVGPSLCCQGIEDRGPTMNPGFSLGQAGAIYVPSPIASSSFCPPSQIQNH